MNNVCRIIASIIIVCLVISFTGCADSEREYLADISVQLDDRDAEIVIREWRFLLGSGAEVYYRQGGEMTLLGNTTGGDDGYCPFADGKYSLSAEGDTLRVRWSFRGEARQDTWKEVTFSLPAT